jgi:hypothetical protein
MPCSILVGPSVEYAELLSSGILYRESALMLDQIGWSGRTDCWKAPDDGGSAAERRATSGTRYRSCAS